MFSKFYGKLQSQGKPGYENEPIAGQSNDIRTSAHDFGLVRPDDLAIGATRIQPGASSNPNINYSEGLTSHAIQPQRIRGESVGASGSPNRVAAVDNNRMAANTDRSRFRRERTFVGSECAVCEEPLEHTLQGERILQFSCSHVSHEACFYEFIREFDSQYCPSCEAPLHLDTSRGGNVIDINKISNLVRSAGNDSRSAHTPTPTWDSQTMRPPSVDSNQRRAQHAQSPHQQQQQPQQQQQQQYAATTSTRESQPRGSLRDSAANTLSNYASSKHARSDSEATGVASSGYPETTQSGPQWRHDYDVQAMETTPASPQRVVTRNPIPAPIVTVRSEFPTINRSRRQQTITCLVTIEVPDNQWRPDPEDIGSPPLQRQGSLGRIDDVTAYAASPAPTPAPVPRFQPYESPEVLEKMSEDLRSRVDNWNGLDFDRFGKLRLYGTLRVGKDKINWQELQCFLFSEMFICVRAKKSSAAANAQRAESSNPPPTKYSLKGSILIKKHLSDVAETADSDDNVLTLSLTVPELPQFHLHFENRNQLKLWYQGLMDLNAVDLAPMRSPEYDQFSENDEEADWHRQHTQRVSSNTSSWGPKSATTAPTEYTSLASKASALPMSVHIPIDVVVVVPISSSMQGVKINLVRDALKFMVSTLGERDRMGLVTFGSGGGGVPIVGMTTKAWPGWSNILGSIKPVGQKSHRADVVEGANVAMDLLMQRKHSNPTAAIMLISDASTSDTDSVDFVISRAEAAKITIHTFGLGMTHKPDTMIELSTKTKASYTYVQDWMMLRECLAGCLGGMQALSHQNVKLKLKLPEGSPAKFYKINGALQTTKRATGRDAEASLGDLRFGDKRDILVQLVVLPDTASQDQLPQDAWDSIVSGLEALGGSSESDPERGVSVEEVPLIQADVSWGDVLRDGAITQMPRPSLLAITMLPAATSSQKKTWQGSPPIPPHPSIVQRRMELLTSDMLSRALTLVTRSQHDRAHTLLNETRSILKGLGKGGLPPVPTNKSAPSTPHPGNDSTPNSGTPDRKRSPSPPSSQSSNGLQTQHRSSDGVNITTGVDSGTVMALDAELERALEWINHPAVFGRDSRKAVLQAIGVISSQRAFTFRTPIEKLWAGRVAGIRRLSDKSREWREDGGDGGGIMEEA